MKEQAYWNSPKLRTYSIKETIRRLKEQLTEQKIFTSHLSNKDLVSQSHGTNGVYLTFTRVFGGNIPLI